MLFGSDGLGLEFNSHEDAQLIGMLSLSVILFSGGMDTKRRDIEPVASQGLMLSTVGVLITLLSLAIQGTTITTAAHKLDLATEEPKTGNDFGVELPDELESQLSELTLTEESLAGGNRLQDMHFPKGTLEMMVKRGNSFIVPNGQLELRPGDILLTIAQQSMDGWPSSDCECQKANG